MDEYITPSQKKHSVPSVFMTPSSSCGRPVYSAPKSFLTTPIPIPSMSPLPTPNHKERSAYSAVGEEHKDIITGLYEFGVPMVVERILSHLDSTEIAHCLLVCQSWNTHISSSQRLSIIVKPLSLTSPQNVKDENSRTTQSVKSLSHHRIALSTINSNSLNTSRVSVQMKPSQKIVGTSIVQLRPCPQCQSPAKRLNARRAECTKCCFDFCQDCLQAWHNKQSCGSYRDHGSPKQTLKPTSIAGTKKAKKRLKRL